MALSSAWLLLLVSFAGSAEALKEIIMRPSCAAGWFYHKSHCYGYFRKMRTWSDAELECQSQGNGSHLASILTLEETTAIARYITLYQKTEHVWIGLYDAQKKQKWGWFDGTTFSFKTWSGRASRDLETDNKYCAALSYKEKFLTWTNNECNKPQHFLCKYRP